MPKISEKVILTFKYPSDHTILDKDAPEEVRTGKIVNVADGIISIRFDIPKTIDEENEELVYKTNVDNLMPVSSGVWSITLTVNGLNY